MFCWQVQEGGGGEATGRAGWGERECGKRPAERWRCGATGGASGGPAIGRPVSAHRPASERVGGVPAASPWGYPLETASTG